jgi:hypothetical protein
MLCRMLPRLPLGMYSYTRKFDSLFEQQHKSFTIFQCWIFLNVSTYMTLKIIFQFAHECLVQIRYENDYVRSFSIHSYTLALNPWSCNASPFTSPHPSFFIAIGWPLLSTTFYTFPNPLLPMTLSILLQKNSILYSCIVTFWNKVKCHKLFCKSHLCCLLKIWYL